MSSGESPSSGNCVHSSARRLYSLTLALEARVWIGSNSMQGCLLASNSSSVGHIVVRPADEGSIRLPYSAKKMALISSDLPRENSATKATLRRSSRSLSCSCERRRSICPSDSSLSASQCWNSAISLESSVRQAE
ncbi:hypothetical protein SDC9_144631 [bioreactor metagenome]|uniref:Uncharacterized protein n=1 Tax=bioreactor metagenome TaxID=1076179 RepID=A0A645E8A6_9ZZZZ